MRLIILEKVDWLSELFISCEWLNRQWNVWWIIGTQKKSVAARLTVDTQEIKMMDFSDIIAGVVIGCVQAIGCKDIRTKTERTHAVGYASTFIFLLYVYTLWRYIIHMYQFWIGIGRREWRHPLYPAVKNNCRFSFAPHFPEAPLLLQENSCGICVALRKS